MSKKDICTTITLQHPEASRKQLIELFITEAGLSLAAAGTYASQIKKELLESAPARAMQAAKVNETDEEIGARLNERFETIDMLANASCLGQIRSLIISGPAGLGKSFTTERAVKAYDPDGYKSMVAKGFVKATGLYLLLHQFRNKGDVLVLDDCDSIFKDEDALNILKAALDTTKERWISWRSETKMQDEDGEPIERTFEYKGTIIFITNKDFDAEIARGGRSAEHFEALISRSHYVECDMHGSRDYVIRIQQVCAKGMLIDQKGMSAAQSANIVDYIIANQSKLRELTLRMALKLADVYLMDVSKFEQLAKISCHKRGV